MRWGCGLCIRVTPTGISCSLIYNSPIQQDLDVGCICGFNTFKTFCTFLYLFFIILFFFLFLHKGNLLHVSDNLQNKSTGTLTSEKNRRHIKMTAFQCKLSFCMEKSVQFLALFKQSSIEQERMARFSFLFHVEDEVPEVYARDFLSCILPGRRSPRASLTPAGHAQALQREQSQKSCNSEERPRTPGFTTTKLTAVLF